MARRKRKASVDTTPRDPPLSRRARAGVGTQTRDMGRKKWLECENCADECIVDVGTQHVWCDHCVASRVIRETLE